MESQTQILSGSISRKDFIKSLLVGATAISASVCLGSCESSVDAPSNIDFTLDIVTTALVEVGGSVTKNGVVVVRLSQTEFVAVQAACTHEGTNINWQNGSKRFVCPNHGATFSSNGTVTNGPATTNLKTYNISLSGNTLRVFS